MSEDKVILHWLDSSRSRRTLWLLEELKVNYELKTYFRDKNYRAPKELEKIFPLGKSPVLEIVSAETGKSRVLAETGYVTEYLIDTYDKEKRFVPDNEDDLHWYRYFLHYTEGTLQSLQVSLLINSVAKKKAPFGTRFLMSKLVDGINDGYYVPEFMKNIEFLENHLKSRPFFAGDKLTAVDMLLSFPIADNIVANKERVNEMAGRKVDIDKEFPNIVKWAKKIQSEPLNKKAFEIESSLVNKVKM